ncbi:MAG TPA: C-terminal helicase domain-containing protein, partial [Saprospiraceae bacterium]|nr:C-terminal helicase domain-containing protein [Saprospiraceae bacterium]
MILCEHLYQLCDQLDKENFPGIALISPYREQVLHMRTALDEDSKLQNLPVQVNTIDGFQGQERDVIYISLVRSNNKAEIGFLNDYRRMNVAMTRARKLLVVVGDSGTIGANPFYADFLNYVEKEGAYLSAWEYMR